MRVLFSTLPHVHPPDMSSQTLKNINIRRHRFIGVLTQVNLCLEQIRIFLVHGFYTNYWVVAIIIIHLIIFLFVEEQFPEEMNRLVPICKEFIVSGTTKQAKQAIRCLFKNTTGNVESLFSDILEVSVVLTKQSNSALNWLQ